MVFNRDRNRGGNRGGFRSRPSFSRPRFGDRGDRGPVEMHQAICDNCGKSCEVPFRPTQGKPVYCSACFENRSSDSRPDSRRQPQSFEQPNDNAQFETLNSKLDKIISLLSDSPLSPVPAAEEVLEEVKKPRVSKKATPQTS